MQVAWLEILDYVPYLYKVSFIHKERDILIVIATISILEIYGTES